MEQIVIPNPEKLNEKIEKFKKEGISKIHVVSDFDRTLTKAFVDGEKVSSVISILRDEGYLTNDYSSKAKALFEKYHVIEIDPDFPLDEKKKLMKKWWVDHFELLIKSKLNKSDVANVVQSEKLVFREGVREFLLFLNEKDIPFLIFSANGLGGDSIEMLLEKKNMFYEDIEIVSNKFNWDKKGFAVSYKEPIIHVFNKGETAIQDFPIFDKVRGKSNVILIGDSLGDVKMAEGFDYEEIIKIGFLNSDIDNALDDYEKVYDVMILNDGNFNFINKLFDKILDNKS
jgi:cytosolic 5'-nucleotidase 3